MDGLLVFSSFFVGDAAVEVVSGQPRCQQESLFVLFGRIGKVGSYLGIFECVLRGSFSHDRGVRHGWLGVDRQRQRDDLLA